MNLRNYKSPEKVTHDEPFVYPVKREFRPEKAFEPENEHLN